MEINARELFDSLAAEVVPETLPLWLNVYHLIFYRYSSTNNNKATPFNSTYSTSSQSTRLINH